MQVAQTMAATINAKYWYECSKSETSDHHPGHSQNQKAETEEEEQEEEEEEEAATEEQ